MTTWHPVQLPALQCPHVLARPRLAHCCIPAAWLEKLKGLVAVVERKLGDGIAVPAYPSYAAFLRNPKDVVKERSLYAGDSSKAMMPA